MDHLNLPVNPPSGNGLTRRLVILGASNVTLGLPLIIDAVRRSLTGPVDIFAAQGHGRSFCQWSYVLYRGLPSIMDSGLWSALDAQPAAEQTWGLVTDVGNDLLYGVPPQRVLAQVHDALQRLRSQGASLTVVRPPLERILMLSSWEYRITKKLLFPGPTIPWKEMAKLIVMLDQDLAELSAQLGARVLVPPLDWYGLDPIHIRRSRKCQAWQQILSTWPFAPPPLVRWPGARFSWQTWIRRPEERTLWKKVHRQSQPAWRLQGGTTLWLY